MPHRQYSNPSKKKKKKRKTHSKVLSAFFSHRAEKGKKDQEMMFKKRSSAAAAAPILQKVSSFLKVQILILSRKMRKPVISRIISLKKSRKNYGYYNYNYNYYYYVKEYQFSPSSSPLIQHSRRKPVMKKKKNGYGGSDLYSMAFLGKCSGIMKEKEERRRSSGFMSCYPPRLPLMEEVMILPSSSSSAEDFCGGGGELEDADDSIDERAEKFIERFYEDMRLQRQDSFASF